MYTNVEKLYFRDVYCAGGMDAVFGGHGTGSIVCENIVHEQIEALEKCGSGIKILLRSTKT